MVNIETTYLKLAFWEGTNVSISSTHQPGSSKTAESVFWARLECIVVYSGKTGMTESLTSFDAKWSQSRLFSATACLWWTLIKLETKEAYEAEGKFSSCDQLYGWLNAKGVSLPLNSLCADSSLCCCNLDECFKVCTYMCVSSSITSAAKCPHGSTIQYEGNHWQSCCGQEY